jgi:MarR family transcriptional regulator, transcriptional regulator for hemolysin
LCGGRKGENDFLESNVALDYDWENSVGYWICAASHSLRKALDSRLNKEGITIRQWEVLAWLSARGCGSQSELADQLGIKPHTLVGVLSRMEKAKLITRRSSQEDRRKKTIHATKKAEALWLQVSKITHDMRDQAVQGMSKTDLDNLKSLCETVYNNFADQNGINVPFEIRKQNEG